METTQDNPLFNQLSQKIPAISTLKEMDLVCTDIALKEISRAVRWINPFFEGSWRFFLSSGSLGKTLVFDSHMGSGSLGMATNNASVTSLHPDDVSAANTAKRVMLLSSSNISIVTGTNLPKLPFGNHEFDTVIVLCWADAHRVLTGDLVAELDRVMKADGTLLLKGIQKTGDIFSVSSQLRQRGLIQRKYFRVLKDNNGMPYRIQNISKHHGLSGYFKNMAHLIREPASLAIVTKRKSFDEKPSTLKRILTELSDISPGVKEDATDLHLGSFDVYRLDTPTAIVRLPTTAQGLALCRNNVQALMEIKKLGLSYETPGFLKEGNVDGQPFFVEQRISGATALYINERAAKRLQVIRQGQKLLLELYQKTERKVVVDSGLFKRIFSDPIEAVCAHLGNSDAEKMRQLSEALRTSLMGKSLSVVRTHGDFKINNFLLNERHLVSGLIDWDLSQSDHLPLMDMALCLGFEEAITKQCHIYASIYRVGFESSSALRSQIVPELRAFAESGVGFELTAYMAMIAYCLKFPDVYLQSNREWNTGILPFLMNGCSTLLLKIRNDTKEKLYG